MTLKDRFPLHALLRIGDHARLRYEVGIVGEVEQKRESMPVSTTDTKKS